MALPERTFGPSSDGSSVYLDTTGSQWLDATLGKSFLKILGLFNVISRYSAFDGIRAQFVYDRRGFEVYLGNVG